jgi:hypothetical protein
MGGSSNPIKVVTKTVEKTVGNVIHDTGKAVGKAVNQTVKVADKVVDKGVEIGKNIANSSIKSITDLAKGDIVGSLTNIANVATGGTVDLTGRNQGVVNVDTKKYIAKAMGAGDLGASGVGSVVVPVTTNKTGKSGLVTQLRKGKGSVGGGSYSEIAKNPLGGSSGKTGK